MSWVGTEGEANIMVQVSFSLSPILSSLSRARARSLSLFLSLSRALSHFSAWRRNDRKHCNKCDFFRLLPYAIVITVYIVFLVISGEHENLFIVTGLPIVV